MTDLVAILGIDPLRAQREPIDFSELKRRLRAWEREHGRQKYLVDEMSPGWPRNMHEDSKRQLRAQLAAFGIVGCDVRINESGALELVELPGEAVTK